MLPADENVEAKRSASIRTSIRGVLKLMRHFPYTELLVVFFPFYAYLITIGYVTSPLALFLMAPFVLTNAVGFIYNNIVDLNDPSAKNPIVAGDITLPPGAGCLHRLFCSFNRLVFAAVHFTGCMGRLFRILLLWACVQRTRFEI